MAIPQISVLLREEWGEHDSVISIRLSQDLTSLGPLHQVFWLICLFRLGRFSLFRPCLYLLFPSVLFHNIQINDNKEKPHFIFKPKSPHLISGDGSLLLLLFHLILKMIFSWGLYCCPCSL